jgi:adenylosuccinate lyase
VIERYRVPEIYNIWSDENKFRKFFEVELAVLKAREELGEIPKGISRSLKNAKFTVERIKEIEEKTHHDVIAFIEAISEDCGEEVRFLHQGLTSSDIVDTAFSLLVMEISKIIKKEINILLDTLKEKALKYKELIMMGRTHGVHAEPISLGFKVLYWYSEMKRAKERFIRASDEMGYGKISGAVGNFAHLDPAIEKKALEKLNLKAEPISSQVIPRDRYAEYQFSLAMIGSAIEHIAQEIRHLQRTEIRELEEPFRKGQKGSSSMPHKRNPIICERLCGMSRLLRSFLITSFENISLWNERDISHSSTERIYLPDSTELIVYMLRKLSFVIKNFNVYTDNMKRNIELTNGLIFSQRVLFALIEKGFSREDAYKIIQENAMEVWEKGGNFKKKLESDKRLSNVFSKKELNSIFDVKYYLKNEDKIYKRVLS